jgi:replicative DNA helicase
MKLRPSVARVLTQAEQARQHPGQLHGLLTGIASLDRRLRGMKGLVLCGARPSMGKTTFVQTVIKNVCEESILTGTPMTVGFLSAEMNEDDLSRRWMCMVAGVRAEDLDTGTLGQAEITALYEAGERISKWPLMITAKRSPTLDFVTNVFQHWHDEAGDSLSLLVVDHLGEIWIPGEQSDYRVQTQVATVLSDTADELDIPVLAAAQLSRKVEERENKRPQLSDFRDSGKIEEKAESALLLYRPAYYEAQKTGQEVGIAPMEIIVAKGRNTGTGTALVDFVPDYPRIEPHASGALPKGI